MHNASYVFRKRPYGSAAAAFPLQIFCISSRHGLHPPISSFCNAILNATYPSLTCSFLGLYSRTSTSVRETSEGHRNSFSPFGRVIFPSLMGPSLFPVSGASFFRSFTAPVSFSALPSVNRPDLQFSFQPFSLSLSIFCTVALCILRLP